MRHITLSNPDLALVDWPRAPLSIDGDVDECAFGHFGFRAADAPRSKGVNFDCHRCAAGFDDLNIAADQVANEYWLVKRHRLNCDRRRPALNNLGSDSATGEVHLGQNPAAKNVAIGVRVSRHGHRADGGFAAWPLSLHVSSRLHIVVHVLRYTL